jgi:FO synthase
LSGARALLERAILGHRPSTAAALSLAGCDDLDGLMAAAEALAVRGHGRQVSYSRKVFIPLTHLCRDVCHYCTFARPPRRGQAAYRSPDQVLAIARAGRAAGCKEALFTLGDKPELRYRAARDALAALGYDGTLSYLEAMARLTLEETGLLPHLNPGVMTEAELRRLRRVSASMGLMLESSAERLCARGGVHWGSPDKRPAVRLATIRAAGELEISFTTGILIGIGETRRERVESLLALRDLHDRYGHIQEIIIQNFRAKSGTRMAGAPEPSLEDHLWTVAVARLLFGPDMAIQAPPNLQQGGRAALIGAGLNDWGGVSPVTPDHVNPEAPWPHVDELAAQTAAAGRTLTERLAIYPRYVRRADTWLDPALRTTTLQLADATGRARSDPWSAGTPAPLPKRVTGLIEARGQCRASPEVRRILDRVDAGHGLGEAGIVTLFAARGPDFGAVVEAADRLRRATVGDTVTYVVNRNINYTNVCHYRCGFCAFSKGRSAAALRGRPYDLAHGEIARRVAEAWDRGATEVCLQGGIHPDYSGRTYLEILDAVRAAAPAIHIHAFSPLEVSHGARSLRLSLPAFLAELAAAGLATLPGTAAEILDDEVRRIICPDKLTTDEWLAVMRAAHELGLRTTATIMFGHVDGPEHWARHLLRVRALQAETGGFTEFVPLSFVHMEAPIWLKGRARPGPTFREAVLMHAVARLALHPLIPNIQASWVKLGPAGASACLDAGANDLGGTLMNESITRAAGAAHGQEMSPEAMERLIDGLGRAPRQRTTLYGTAPEERRAHAFAAPAVAPLVETPLARHARREGGRERAELSPPAGAE